MPEGSAIGKGHVSATAGDGRLKSEIEVTPYDDGGSAVATAKAPCRR